LTKTLARQAAANVGAAVYPQDHFAGVIRLLKERNAISAELGRALRTDVVLDRGFLNGPALANFGGFDYMNKVFDDDAEDLLHDINEELWREGA
jgi:hypothetical protein